MSGFGDASSEAHGATNWIAEQRRIYFDNAILVREFRTQLRGIKAPLLLTFYGGLLTLIACVFYWGISLTNEQSVAQIQDALKIFFNVIVYMLEFMVALIAPALASATIVSEYSRQSIDLLFSSPVGTKYFVIGKAVASFRYVLLLLVLTIPISAMCVVMGGATWKDVLLTYVFVMVHGVIYMAIALPIAVMTGKAVPAVLWSYMAGGLYFLISTIPTMAVAFSGFGRGVLTMPPFAGLSPAIAPMAGQYGTELFGQVVPLVVPTLVIAGLFLRLMMVGTGSILTQAGSKECCNLRVTSLLTLLFGTWAIGLASVPWATGVTKGTGSPWATVVFWCCIPLVFGLPYLSTWSGSGSLKSWPNGWWNLKLVLRGTPASGLPFLAACMAVATLGAGLGLAGSGSFSVLDLLYLLGVWSTWFFVWALGWLCSVPVFRAGHESARRLLAMSLFLTTMVPLFALSVLEGVLNIGSGTYTPPLLVARFYPFSFFGDPIDRACVKVGVIVVLGVGVFILSELKRKKLVASLRGQL
ncbi:MAG: ABC transporter permease [Chthonomonadaceae bacterium]|nr:ABC transporter permease [Chthonomonadaceae bacterium]